MAVQENQWFMHHGLYEKDFFQVFLGPPKFVLTVAIIHLKVQIIKSITRKFGDILVYFSLLQFLGIVLKMPFLSIWN